jgi:hypothetical protein
MVSRDINVSLIGSSYIIAPMMHCPVTNISFSSMVSVRTMIGSSGKIRLINP